MLVAVACGQCSKPFQVPQDALGTKVPCPWCSASVPALPVAGVPVAPTPAAPLSLDQAVQLSDAPASPILRGRTFVKLALLLAAMSVALFGGWLASKYGTGRIWSRDWRAFAPPDGGCKIEMPSDPVEEPLVPDPKFPGLLGGKRFVSQVWYADVSVSIGWIDVDPAKAKRIRDEDLIASEAGRRGEELGAKPIAKGVLQDQGYPGTDIEYPTPTGPAFERMIAALTATKPRLYVITIRGPSLDLNAPLIRRVFGSFSLDERGK